MATNTSSEILQRCLKRAEEIKEKEAELASLENKLDYVQRKIVAAERDIYGQKKQIAKDYGQQLENCNVLLIDSDELFRFAIQHVGHDQTKKFKLHPDTTDDELRAIYQTSAQTSVPIFK